jgi:hypothetical protein
MRLERAIPRTSRRRIGILVAASLMAMVASFAGAPSAQAAGNGTPVCGSYAGFAYVTITSGGQCFQGTGTYGISQPITFLVNNTGFRVWTHNASGGAVCYDHGYASDAQLAESAGRLVDVQITANSAPCSPRGPAICGRGGPMATLQVVSDPIVTCYFAGTTTSLGSGTQVTRVTNATGFRVWLHQNADNSGWSLCFNNNNVYTLPAFATEPGNIQVSTNSAPC